MRASSVTKQTVSLNIDGKSLRFSNFAERPWTESEGDNRDLCRYGSTRLRTIPSLRRHALHGTGKLVRLERALSVLEASNAIDRVKALEAITTLRERNDQEAAKLVAADKALKPPARSIQRQDGCQQILTEQFDTVMPLLKELYRRLRPHANWVEIESDFGGKFVVLLISRRRRT